MGKSGKKIKSDRINTLRKQYDAFLEDDKKRKDRNEYILGRLEEMRSSSALVQIRHKDDLDTNENYYTTRRIPYSRLEDNVRTFRNQANIPNSSTTQRFEPSILREISKSFILIPKLKSNISNNVTYFNPLTDNADTDWKSKYDILNELKNSEKECNSENVNVIFEECNKPFVPTPESLITQENQIYGDNTPADNLQNFNTPTDDSQTSKSNSNGIEKVILNASPDFKANNTEDKAKICSKPTDLLTEPINYYENNQNEISVGNTHEIEASRQEFTEPKSEIRTNMEVYNNVANINASQELTNTEYTNKVDNNNEFQGKSDKEKFDDELMEQNKSKEFYEQRIKEKNISHAENSDCLKLTNNKDISTKEEIQESFKDDIEIDSKLNDIQNYEINDVPIINDQSANAEISELENEQNEMFYTENPENKYNYDENNMEKVQYPEENQNYINEQYSYHDESQQEQPYNSEINEHEESTERYDPNYEQQYTGNYENVMDVPHYETQQYEVENSYEVQQNPVSTANVNYEEVQPNSENIERMPSEDPYQNPEENVYNYGNENYESQQYNTNEQQEYTTTDPNDLEDQYAVEQEYVGRHTEEEILKGVEKGLDLEDGYVDNQNTIIIDNKESTVVPDVSPDKKESILET
ncbi:unnamed protein product [Euphydryas editha]|uniref:Uncharacterized protein n=1 Tax=Euphydryas editha TaxID=104508 RepID=A0AAU9U6Y9_EUPED|nr:unnamed protein product [Euphydryas editha]